MENVQQENWGGWLVNIKEEWLNPDERRFTYVVLEDLGDRVLIQVLPLPHQTTSLFPHKETVLKEYLHIIDKEIQHR